MIILPPLALLGIGSSELLLVLAVVLILLGPQELPKIARKIGKLMSQLRNVSDDFQQQIMRLDEEPPPSDPAPQAPAMGGEYGGESVPDSTSVADNAAVPGGPDASGGHGSSAVVENTMPAADADPMPAEMAGERAGPVGGETPPPPDAKPPNEDARHEAAG